MLNAATTPAAAPAKVNTNMSDKKVIAGLVESIVSRVATENNIDEGEARVLVGGLIRRLESQIVAVLKPANLTIAPTA